MRCPTQAAPMPPAQAEALYDLGLETGAQEAQDADSVRTNSNATYRKSLMTSAERPRLASNRSRHLQQASALESAPRDGSGIFGDP